MSNFLRILLAFYFVILPLKVFSAEEIQKPPVQKPQQVKLNPETKSDKVGKDNSNLPVEISADSLEVLQQQNKAIFKGNVVAVQGTVRLKSDIMIIHYNQKNDNKNVEKKPVPAQPVAAGQDMGNITLIEVEGNVVIATPEETAQGDKGDYQVATRIIHLTGTNVTLTRGKNILRGTTLEYNMETGRSVFTNGASKSSDTRVRGVFVPNKAEDSKNK